MSGSTYTCVVLCCVVLGAGQPRVSAGFCPSCPPLCLFHPVSVSSSCCSVSLLTRSSFEFLCFVCFYLPPSQPHLFLFLLHLSCYIYFLVPFCLTQTDPLPFSPFYLFSFCLSSLSFCPHPCHLPLRFVLYRFGSPSSLSSLVLPYFFLFCHRILLVFFPPPVQRVLKSPFYINLL